MSKYQKLSLHPPVLNIKDNAREVIFKTISCMCDNEHSLKLKKNSEGDFKMSGGMFALSNWQFKYEVSEIEWSADDSKWDEVISMINSGTEVIESVRSR
jgi:hypothetical protein